MSLWDKKGVAKQIEDLWGRPDEETLREQIAAWVGRPVGAVPGRGNALLDVGCGSARLGPHLKGWRYTGLDASKEMLKLAEARMPRATLVRLDMTNDLPFNDAEFDTVLCVNVLRHLSDYLPGLREMARVAASRILIVDNFHDGLDPQFGAASVAGQAFPDNQWSLPLFLEDAARELPGSTATTQDFGYVVGVQLLRP